MEEPLPPAPVPRKPSPRHTAAVPVLAGTSTPRPAGSQGSNAFSVFLSGLFQRQPHPPPLPTRHPPPPPPPQPRMPLASGLRRAHRRLEKVMSNSVPGGSPSLELGEAPPPPLPPCKTSCARGSRNPPEPKARRGWGLRPWMQARGSECAQLCGKCSLFISALQLVKFYSDRKLVTSHSNYSGLESARAMKGQGPTGIRAGVKGSSSHIFKPSGR